MVLALFVLIAWVIVITYTNIPKSLNKVENIIMFFLVRIIVTNMFTIPELNLKIIYHNNRPEMYISLLINRILTIPFSVLVFLNLMFYLHTKFRKVLTFICGLIFWYTLEISTIGTKLKTYTIKDGVVSFTMWTILPVLSFCLAKLIRKIPEKGYE